MLVILSRYFALFVSLILKASPWQDGELWLREHGSNNEVQQEFAWQNKNFGGDCVFNCQQHVVEHMRSGSAVMNSGADYLANIRAEQAVYESSAAGQRIELGAASAGAGL